MASKLGIKDMVQVVDTGTNNPRGDFGSPDLTATDYLEVSGNGTNREVVLSGKNASEDPVDIPVKIGNGSLFFPPQIATASLPAAAAANEGAIAYDTTLNMLVVSTGSAWVIVGEQTDD